MRRLAILVALASLTTTACSSGGEPCTVPDGLQPDWIRVIGCEADYELLWTERSDAVFARTLTINWIIDREQENRIYFIDTDAFTLHFFFAETYLNITGLTPVGTHAEFNILNYRRDNRRFVLGKLIRYVDQDLLTLEMSAGDTAGAEMIVDAFERVADAIHDGDRLRYRPVSADQEDLLPEIESQIPIVRTEEVFQGQTYQPLHPAVGYGTLRFRRVAELSGRPLAPTDIAVLDRVPTDLALTGGVITDEFQTPLSHVNILSKNRGTPNMALRGAFEDDALRGFEDQLVRLEVTTQSYDVRPATLLEAQTFWDSLRPSEPLVPVVDSTVVGVVDLATVGWEAASSIGSKAANLAELGRITIRSIPRPDLAMAIPFSSYEAHLAGAGLDVVAAAIVADVAAGEVEADELAARLFDLRWRIFRAPMDVATRDALVAELGARWSPGTRLRFRSSTNAEDLPEFSGAGLYTSAGASRDEGDAAIENAIKVVWASVWSHQAFVERDFYRVEHDLVRMGVLVHPAFEDEAANGVAVTINEFAENRPAYYINSQIGEVSVTNPTGLAVPEQILFYTWYEEPEYEVITRSSLLANGAHPDWPGGPAVLTRSQLLELADSLEAIHNHFRALTSGGPDFAMDIEFKLDAARNLVIKQARPLKQR